MELQSTWPETAEVTDETWAAARNGCRQSQEVIFKNNLKLVGLILKKWRFHGTLDYDEVASAAQFGLYQSIERFDPAKGKFSTYATRYIRGHLLDAVGTHNRQTRRMQFLTEIDTKQLAARNERTEYERDEIDEAHYFVDKLQPRSADILKRRFGIKPYTKPQTMREVGKSLNISKERVNQIEKLALREVRRMIETRRLSQ